MPGDFMKAFADNEIARIVIGIERAVQRSFPTGTRITDTEVRRRFSICERLFRQLRGDLGWGLQRVLDHLPHYLRCELDGQPWEPDRRTLWMPQDGT
jgi:hypothetical protein